MKKILFILLLTIPFVGFGQNIYNINDLTFNQDSSLVLLKSNNTPVSGVLKQTCKRKGVVLKNKTQCEFSYKNGLLMSTKGYYSNKQISEETQRNGMCIYYYKNGEIECMGNTKEGKYNGVWKWNNRKGELVEELTWEEDELISEKVYDKGELVEELTWEEDELISEKVYDKKGLLWYENEWISDNSYTQKQFDSGGFVIIEGTVTDGKEEGVWKYYDVYEDGTRELYQEIIWKYGKKIEVTLM